MNINDELSTQGQTFIDNLTVALEGAISISCNCSFTITTPQVYCYDNMSILLVGSVASNEMKLFRNWINQSNYLALNMLTVDKSFCSYQIPSLSAVGCSSPSNSQTIASTYELQVGMAAGGAAIILCCFNLFLVGLKLARRKKER